MKSPQTKNKKNKTPQNYLDLYINRPAISFNLHHNRLYFTVLLWIVLGFGVYSRCLIIYRFWIHTLILLLHFRLYLDMQIVQNIKNYGCQENSGSVITYGNLLWWFLSTCGISQRFEALIDTTCATIKLPKGQTGRRATHRYVVPQMSKIYWSTMTKWLYSFFKKRKNSL